MPAHCIRSIRDPIDPHTNAHMLIQDSILHAAIAVTACMQPWIRDAISVVTIEGNAICMLHVASGGPAGQKHVLVIIACNV
jgi:hypothetical protein